MLNRREALRLVPVSSLACLEGALATQAAQAAPRAPSGGAGPLTGPPVVQRLTTAGFAVSFAVGQLATGWVEWGFSAERLDQRYRGFDTARGIPASSTILCGGG